MNRLARRDAHQAAPACVWEFAIVNANGHLGLLQIGNISVEVLHVVLERHPHDGDTRRKVKHDVAGEERAAATVAIIAMAH